MEMKRYGLIFCALLLAAAFINCAKPADVVRKVIQPPEVSVSDVSITSISASSVALALTLEIKNPNPVSLTFTSLDYQLEMADRPVASGSTTERMAIPANGSTKVKTPVALKYSELAAAYDAAKGLDQVPYKVTGKVRLDTPIGVIPIPIIYKNAMTVVRPPRIQGVGIRVNRLALDQATVSLDLDIYNPNSFNLEITTAEYTLKLGEKVFSSGMIAPTSIKAKSNATLSVPVSISFASVGAWAYSALLKGSAVYDLSYFGAYKMQGKSVIQQESKAGNLSIWR
jgi:LEA14-like dessication related protein